MPSQISQLERDAYAEFDTIYTQKFPPPQNPRLQTFLNMGLEFWISVIQAIASVIFSAVRTGPVFYESAAKSAAGATGIALGWIEAIAGILAYDFFLIGVGIVDGQKNRRMHGWVKVISIGVIWLTITAAGFSVASEFGKVFDIDTSGINSFVAVTLAFASIPMLIGGEMLGQSYAEGKDAIAEARRKYDLDLKRWKRDRAESWKQKRMSYIRRLDPNAVDPANRPAPAAPGQPETQSRTVQPKVKLSDLVRDYVVANQVDISGQVDYGTMKSSIEARVGERVDPASLRQAIKRMRESQSQN